MMTDLRSDKQTELVCLVFYGDYFLLALESFALTAWTVSDNFYLGISCGTWFLVEGWLRLRLESAPPPRGPRRESDEPWMPVPSVQPPWR